MTRLRRLSLATTLTTITVIGVGALVRATGSGDGCPDWPRCFGRWIPPLEKHALIEYSHRTVGAIAIALLCVTAVAAFRRRRSVQRGVWLPLVLATPAIFMQALLGAVVVVVKGRPQLSWFEPWLITFHIATAMALLGALVHATVKAFQGPRATGANRLSRFAKVAAAAVYAQILIGAYVRGEHAGLAFPDFPLMNGTLLPELGGGATAMFAHRLAGVVVAVIVIAFAVRARRQAPGSPAAAFATGAALLTLAQIVVGGAQVWTTLAVAPVVAHVVLAALIWSASVAAASSAGAIAVPVPATDASPVEQVRPTASSTIKAYIALTKPRIIVLLLITTVPTMILAARGLPSLWLIAATVGGGALAAGAANALNMVIDRDIDEVMTRTRKRPLPAHAIGARAAVVFATALAVASFIVMTATVNLLAALLTQSAIAFYVLVYTMRLKRSTPNNIVIGGAAGAVPVLVGWAAVTGTLSWGAWILFAVVFLWTPPHFWALAMRFAKDYASAGVPMMPVVAGAEETQRQIVLYSLGTVALTIVLWPVAQMGSIYIAAACGLGAWLLRAAMVLHRDGTPAAAMGMFKYSISYLALLFAAVGVDALLPLGV